VTAIASAPTSRDSLSARQILEQLKKVSGTGRGLLITAAPRAGLQIMQPANVSEALIKAYAKDFHAEDRLTWQTIVKNKPTRLNDAWSARELEGTPYAQEWLKPNDLMHVVAVPIGAPVFDGYPGVVHMGRTSAEGSFSNAEVQKLTEAAASVGSRLQAARTTGKAKGTRRGAQRIERPDARLIVLDSQLKARTLGNGAWSDLDDRLKNQIVEQAKRRLGQSSNEAIYVDRVLLPDSHGDAWPFRVVTYKKYPALGDGAHSIFCLQPDCTEWGTVRPADFQADAELARLLPALRFMQAEFRNGPTLVDIAKTVSLSPFHFHRRFTELLGLTPKQFLLDCQIHQAKADLLARDKELVDIAKECGFAHQSHFTSRFKQATGLTPTRWRRMATIKVQESDN
jgi:AraC-like DNA-binding protein